MGGGVIIVTVERYLKFGYSRFLHCIAYHWFPIFWTNVPPSFPRATIHLVVVVFLYLQEIKMQWLAQNLVQSLPVN